jgi:hypothetical protein
MNDQIAALPSEAGETHHRVYRIVDGDDPDWTSWYAETSPELPWPQWYAPRIVERFASR